jgi:peptidoglycan/LPS O-acetylase OafA/YrhL
VAGRFVGVDVFFVISGFLITGPLLADAADGVVSFSKFYSRRALRILPAATVVILATGVASLLILNSVRAKAVLADSLWASVFAANVKFGRDGTDYLSEAAVSHLQHFWSLAVEEPSPWSGRPCWRSP